MTLIIDNPTVEKVLNPSEIKYPNHRNDLVSGIPIPRKGQAANVAIFEVALCGLVVVVYGVVQLPEAATSSVSLRV